MIINDREIEIIQYSTKKDWLKEIPNENWLCVIVENDKPRRYIEEVSTKIIEKNVCYVSTIGDTCERTHDIIDEEIAFREVDIERLYLPEHGIITTWHEEGLEEGLWDAINTAFHGEVDIDKIVILNMTEDIQIIEETLIRLSN